MTLSPVPCPLSPVPCTLNRKLKTENLKLKIRNPLCGLRIFKASAGSGKTTLLTGEYVDILAAADRKDAYRRILAVTFTNKATDEMKSRIVELLYDVARGEKTDTLLNPARAQEVLQSLLHDYSRFFVSTIDRFFQKVIRAFVHELGIRGNYMLQLDTDDFLDEAVSDIMLLLDSDEFKDVLQWFIQSSEELVEEGASWNSLQDNLKTLGRQIFKEQFQLNRQSLSNDANIKACKEQLAKHKAVIEKEMRAFAEVLYDKFKQMPIEFQDLVPRYGSHVTTLGKFAKFGSSGKGANLNSYLRSLVSDGFVKKSLKAHQKQYLLDLESFIKTEHIDLLLEQFIGYYDNNIRLYNTAREGLKFVRSLQIINRINAFVNQKLKDTNTLLISNASELIANIIKDSDSPFIYEKTGTHIDHYFLDEFQDTSALQWNNFRPLIAESLASGNMNLVVGDVKQSIYRFRNSDWEILGKQIETDFPEYAEQNNLLSNYRSGKDIIHFNNSLFPLAAKSLQYQFWGGLMEKGLAESSWAQDLRHLLTDAYADVEQQVPEGRKNSRAYVQLDFVPNDKDAKKARVRSFKEIAFDLAINKIRKLHDVGYPYSSMAALFRGSADAKAFSLKLLDAGIDVISDEALLIASSQKVQLLLAFLRYFVSPTDEINLYRLRTLCPDFDELLPAVQAVSVLPLYRIVAELSRVLGFYENDSDIAYIQAFSDVVSDFALRHGGDISAFLQWWEKNGSGKSVSTPAGGNSVTVMTVHKAKGLAFEVVIMPVCDWELFKIAGFDGNILWCKTSEPFDQIPYLPVRLTGKLADTLFAPDYYREMANAYMDNLNILYVAFTRPRSVLYAVAPINGSDSLSTTGDLLYKCLSSEELQESADCFTYKCGELPAPKAHSAQEEGRVLPACKEFADFSVFKMKAQKAYNQMMELGNRLHFVMSKVHVASDLQRVVKELEVQGVFNSEQADEVFESLRPYVQNPAVAAWFDGSMRSLTERDIITPKGGNYRPDRILLSDSETIVVDYKFGEQHPEHISQVQNYVNLLSQTGLPNAHGYLYYFSGLQIIPVLSEN